MNYLVRDAIERVWCSPQQDTSVNILMPRITGLSGVFNHFKVGWNTYTTPLAKTRFHLFQIGHLYPSLLGIIGVRGKWIKVSDCCVQEKMLFELYNQHGYMYPRTETWYLVTEDRNIIVAIKDQPTINIQGDKDDIFLRVYSPSYFTHNDSTTTDDGLFVDGGTVLTTQAILALQTQVADYRTKPGHVYCFVNGQKVAGIDLISTKPGDVAEFVYDSSIYMTVSFKVKDLLTYDSTLDMKRKYLLHHAKSSGYKETNYVDDVDIFLVKPKANGRHEGVYYHQFREDSIRMVTHRDYSIPVSYLIGYVLDADKWGDPEELELIVHIRKSGWVKPLINEHHRVSELYKLSDVDIVRAMLGVDSVIAEWRVDALERSKYTELMRTDLVNINPDIVEQAYGYNAISRLIGDSPAVVRIASSQKVVDVPFVMQKSSTAYEYDVNGNMVGFFTHSSGPIYACRNIKTTHVEFFSGVGSDMLEEYYGDVTTIVNPLNTYRFYKCKTEAGTPDYDWKDVTDTGAYAVEGGRVTWFGGGEDAGNYHFVRGDGNFLAYNLMLSAKDGLLQFTLASRVRVNGVLTSKPMAIQMGRLDLFLNEKYLIEGIDYILNFPKVVIINKEYLKNTSVLDQKIHVRWTGHCNNKLMREGYKDRGFVQYGQLSRNAYFNLRDDRVIGIYVDGEYKTRDAFKMTEDTTDVDVLNPKNGAPYAIRDNMIQTRGLTMRNAYVLRDIAQEVDSRFEQYLTLKIPEGKTEQPNIINGKYQVVTPFLAKIINDLDSGIIDDPRITQHYGEQFVISVCQPYEWLLAFDPTQEGTLVDKRFVDVQPTNLFTVMELSIYHYKFISKVVEIYMRDKVSLSHFIKIKSLGVED
jgi:hypothetical protein